MSIRTLAISISSTEFASLASASIPPALLTNVTDAGNAYIDVPHNSLTPELQVLYAYVFEQLFGYTLQPTYAYLRGKVNTKQSNKIGRLYGPAIYAQAHETGEGDSKKIIAHKDRKLMLRWGNKMFQFALGKSNKIKPLLKQALPAGTNSESADGYIAMEGSQLIERAIVPEDIYIEFNMQQLQYEEPCMLITVPYKTPVEQRPPQLADVEDILLVAPIKNANLDVDFNADRLTKLKMHHRKGEFEAMLGLIATTDADGNANYSKLDMLDARTLPNGRYRCVSYNKIKTKHGPSYKLELEGEELIGLHPSISENDPRIGLWGRKGQLNTTLSAGIKVPFEFEMTKSKSEDGKKTYIAFEFFGEYEQGRVVDLSFLGLD